MPSNSASTEVMKELLSPTLDRQVQTKKLSEESKSRNKVSFDSHKWTQKYKWLITGNEGCFCIICKLFCNKASKPRIPGILTAKPYTRYSRVKDLSDHADTKYHKEAEIASQSFLTVAEGKMPNIRMQVGGCSKEFYITQKRLHSIAKTLLDCAKQNLALRGHRNEKLTEEELKQTAVVDGDVIVKGDENRGNFIHLLRSRADAGDSNVMAAVHNKALFFSSAIQNEMLMNMAQEVHRSVISRIGVNPFSIIADETTDASVQEQLSFSVRYLENDAIQERFLCFVKLDSLTGKSLYMSVDALLVLVLIL